MSGKLILVLLIPNIFFKVMLPYLQVDIVGNSQTFSENNDNLRKILRGRGVDEEHHQHQNEHICGGE